MRVTQTEYFRETLRNQLRKLTRFHNQKTIARILRTNQPRVSRLLSGEKTASFRTIDLLILSRAMDLSIEVLIHGGGLLEQIDYVKKLVINNPQRFVDSLNEEERNSLLRTLFHSFDD